MNKDWLNATLVNQQLVLEVKTQLDLSSLGSYKEEYDLAVMDVAFCAGNRPIFISYSGGTDSEYVCDTFARLGIPFEAVICRFGPNEEYDRAVQYCKRQNIKLHVLDVDSKWFFEYVIEELHPTIKTHSIGAYVQMFIVQWVELQNGVCVGSNGNPLLDDIPGCVYWDRNVLDKLLNIPQPISFVSYSQELAYLYVQQYDESTPLNWHKFKLYGMPYRPKVNIFTDRHIERYLHRAHSEGFATKPFFLGSRANFLRWITNNVIPKS